MSKIIQSIRGMHDILPERMPAWQYIERVCRGILEGYGYQEIRLPIVEMTQLFARSIGEVTDIVEKEMYSFEDRNGDSLSLRPEGTAGCVRAGIEHGLLHNQQQRLWYIGPMFRHERPQKGRYRQFHQIGVEAFGYAGPDIDAELILTTARLWHRLGLKDLRLEINSLGSSEARAEYRRLLVDYLEGCRDELDEDSQRRLHGNPLRVLDSKNPEMRSVIAEAPSLLDHLDPESKKHFDGLCALLDATGVSYVVNPRLVRGLDYYSRTVFEWISESLGAQGTVCAGGRYDSLIELLGGRPSMAAGYALGLERLVALLEDQALAPAAHRPDAYLIAVGPQAERVGLLLAERLRGALEGLSLVVNCGGGSFKSQMRRADRSGAEVALILGETEVERNEVTIKPLRDENAAQQSLSPDALERFLAGIGSKGRGRPPDQTAEASS